MRKREKEKEEDPIIQEMTRLRGSGSTSVRDSSGHSRSQTIISVIGLVFY